MDYGQQHEADEQNEQQRCHENERVLEQDRGHACRRSTFATKIIRVGIAGLMISLLALAKITQTIETRIVGPAQRRGSRDSQENQV